ncbi:hypothetical protein APUTEX25_005145, partial [Auxenochlorella protothecoides]
TSTMRLLIALLLLAATAFAFNGKVESGSGAIAQSGQPLRGFNCQYNRVNSYFAQNYASLPAATFDGSASCGRCVSVKCTDDSCSGLPAVTALVVDQCYSCSTSSGLKLSSPAFKTIAGMSSGSVSASWEFVSCGSLIQGNPVLTSSDPTNIWWQSLTFSNSRKPLAAVSLNGLPMNLQPWGPWVWSAQGLPLNITSAGQNALILQATDGETLAYTLSNLAEQELDGQFSLNAVLENSFFFYDAQRSGRLPADNPVPWRGNSHLNDPVVGGYYDAGDYLKLNFPLGTSLAFLGWGLLEFPAGYDAAGLTARAKASLKWGTDYLVACHVAEDQYIGQIGDPGIDHAFWGRAEEQTGARPAFTWTSAMPASDLASSAASALAAASLVFASDNATYSASLLSHAQRLFDFGARNEGLYSSSYTAVTYVYSSTTYLDDLAFAAGWLYRATKNPSYLTAAQTYLQRAQYSRNYYVNWDGVFPAADMLLKSLGVANSAGVDLDTQLATFRATWQQGQNGVTITPKGLSIPPFGGWGNLRHALNAAFVTAIHAKYNAGTRAADLAYAKRQLDYALGSSGRSFVVLYGGLVGGPASSDTDYSDVRSNYQGNEVAIDYNAGFTGTLAGLIQLL